MGKRNNSFVIRKHHEMIYYGLNEVNIYGMYSFPLFPEGLGGMSG
jgi:hypothetical protein